MATKIEAARSSCVAAAAKKDRGERCDLEAGMAKLFASETGQEVALEAMRILGGYGYTQEFLVERYYRDAPLMIIGEGTNEIQRLVIARRLLERAEESDPGRRHADGDRPAVARRRCGRVACMTTVPARQDERAALEGLRRALARATPSAPRLPGRRPARRTSTWRSSSAG